MKFKLHRNKRQHNQNQKQKQFTLLKKCSTQICLRKMTLCFQNVFRDRLINPLLLCEVWSRTDRKGTEATAAHASGLALLCQEHPGIFEHSQCPFPHRVAWVTVGWGRTGTTRLQLWGDKCAAEFGNQCSASFVFGKGFWLPHLTQGTLLQVSSKHLLSCGQEHELIQLFLLTVAYTPVATASPH